MHITGSGGAAELSGGGCRQFHFSAAAIELDQQRRGRIRWIQLLLEHLIHSADREVVHDFHASRQDPGGCDQTHRFASGFHAGEISQQHGHRLGLTQQSQGDRRGDAQGALAANEHPAQIQRGHFRQRTAQGGHRAVGQHHLQLQHVVTGDAVFEAVHAA